MKITFTTKNRHENKCSATTDKDQQEFMLTKLGEDYKATIGKLQEAAYRAVLGRLPSDRQIARQSKITTFKTKGAPDVYTLWYKKRRIAAFTAPITRQKGFHFIMRWYFKEFTK